MAEHKHSTDDIPLPDPDRIQRAAQAALEKMRRRRGFYTGLGFFLLLVVIGVFWFVYRPSPDTEAARFIPLWRHCMAVREKLTLDRSAREELAGLEAYLPRVRGTTEEGIAIWYLGLFNYREAWTSEKLTPEDRKPYLQKALEYLGELRTDSRFDQLLLARPNWYIASSLTPVDRLYNQVKQDLAYETSDSYSEPQPDPDLVAVLRTSAGDIFLQFYAKLAPRHVQNFLTLAAKGTYNETCFHYVGGGTDQPKSIMGGDPFTFFYSDPLKKEHILRWGKGGTGYDLPPEEARFKILHRARIVTSQRRGRGDWDNGAQFQIMLAPDFELDRIHTPFAKVTEGMEIVEQAAARKTASQHAPYKDDFAFGSLSTRYLVVDPVVIHKVIVFRKGKAIEHAFPLDESEKSLSTLKQSKVVALPEDKVYCGRKLRAVDAPGTPRPGLDIPFPDDVDPSKASPEGERKEG